MRDHSVCRDRLCSRLELFSLFSQTDAKFTSSNKYYNSICRRKKLCWKHTHTRTVYIRNPWNPIALDNEHKRWKIVGAWGYYRLWVKQKSKQGSRWRAACVSSALFWDPPVLLLFSSSLGERKISELGNPEKRRRSRRKRSHQKQKQNTQNPSPCSAISQKAKKQKQTNLHMREREKERQHSHPGEHRLG